jgi:hypothetical protein
MVLTAHIEEDVQMEDGESCLIIVKNLDSVDERFMCQDERFNEMSHALQMILL